MNLGRNAIKQALKEGRLRITPEVSDQRINGVSVDLRLSNTFLVFERKLWKPWEWLTPIRLDENVDVNEHAKRVELGPGKTLWLWPHQFVIGYTHEAVTLPKDLSGAISTRSRFARLGLSVHSAAHIIHPGITDSQTALEITNTNHVRPLRLVPGVAVCQMTFTRVEGGEPYSSEGRHPTQRPPSAPPRTQGRARIPPRA